MSWLYYTLAAGFAPAPGVGEVSLGRGERVLCWHAYLRALRWHNHETPFLLPVGSGGFPDFTAFK